MVAHSAARPARRLFARANIIARANIKYFIYLRFHIEPSTTLASRFTQELYNRLEQNSTYFVFDFRIYIYAPQTNRTRTIISESPNIPTLHGRQTRYVLAGREDSLRRVPIRLYSSPRSHFIELRSSTSFFHFLSNSSLLLRRLAESTQPFSGPVALRICAAIWNARSRIFAELSSRRLIRVNIWSALLRSCFVKASSSFLGLVLKPPRSPLFSLCVYCLPSISTRPPTSLNLSDPCW